jgi:hypothetical protein
MPVVTIATLFLLSLIPSSIQKEKPDQKRKMARNGNVKSSRLRRPHVSMVKTAGRAKTQLRMPVPMEARSAVDRPYPES